MMFRISLDLVADAHLMFMSCGICSGCVFLFIIQVTSCIAESLRFLRS